MKAVIYARYSSDNQREESIEGQLRECMAYCKKNDITVLRTYIDRAMSAKTDHRPDFQRMIKDSAKGLFDVIIVWKLDRFARNRYDSAHYKAQLRKYGVKVLSATENISDGPEGIILESMLEGMAEYYSAELSEKVIRGHTENALKCRYNGGTPTFGYIIDKDMQYQIDPRTAPAVLEMFTMYDKGATMKEIVARMSERGVTTVRGKKIDLNFVARLLKNRKYIGEYSYRHIVTPNGIPAIVPQDLFDRVQQRLAVNRKAPARHKAEDDYLLTTKLFCGTCGAMMVGESGTSSSKGRKYHYYRCVNTKKHHACDAKHKTVRKLPLENAVVNAVMAKIMDDNFVEYVADAVMDIQSRESSVLPALRKQMEEAESGITNMLNAIQMGIINASTKQRLDELEERKKDIELQIIQEKMKHPAVSREDVVYFVCRFRSLDTSKLDARRRLIDSFVNAVTIFDDYILITFNYKEGETRIDFADIESSDLQSVGGPIEASNLDASIFFTFTDISPGLFVTGRTHCPLGNVCGLIVQNIPAETNTASMLYRLRRASSDSQSPLLFRCRPSCPEIACHDRPSKDFPILKLFSTNRRLLGRAEPKATDHIGSRGGLPWFIQMIEPQTYIAQKGGVESAPADCAGL